MSSQQAQTTPQLSASAIAAHILFVRNLPYRVTSDDMYELFARYGTVTHIRVGTAKDTRGTAYVVYGRARDARKAVEALSGYNFMGRYLIVLPFQAGKVAAKKETGETERCTESAVAK